MLKNKRKFNPKLEADITNDLTEIDYLQRFTKIALSMFEWVNLPESMDARFLEKSLFYKGQAALLKDKEYGFINTQCTSNNNINIYGLPTDLSCFAYNYYTRRRVYNGIIDDVNKDKDCILVLNNWEKVPTYSTLQLFSKRLAEAERTIDVNIKSCKTPVLITVDDTQRLTMENLYDQYDGNHPIIFGDKNQLDTNTIKSINTGSEFLADKLMEYKKEIWNEALTFLGISNIQVEKKERLTENEAGSQNELINFNLQALLAPRKQACREFNELFGLTGTDKEIDVRVRSDLFNIIKQNESVTNDYNKNGIDDNIEGGDFNE